MNKKETKKTKLKKRTIVYLMQLLSFTLTIVILCGTGLIIPLRPTYSESEKRDLAKFPEFSFESLFNGSYFRGVGDWYSDTYPGRESLVGLNTKIKGYYGLSSAEIHGEVVEGDEIPSVYVPSTDDNSEEPDLIKPEDETWAPINEELDTQSLGAVFVAGNKGYEYYNFVQKEADRYIRVMNSEAEALSGVAEVYDLIVPTSIGITLPDNYKNSINSSNQRDAINYMYSGMNSKVNKVNAYNTLMNHRSEYIYFNTDHHWTALGAYYAYEQFADASGITKVPLANYKQVEYDGFLGSFYNDTGKLPVLENNPDKLIAYVPNENATLVYTKTNGEKIKWKVVNDVSNYGKTLKYSAFIGGDNPFTEIINPDITDGSSIVVVKESFGNAFVPFLVENYSKIYVIDYRYYKGSVSKFVKENGVDTVLYINNISATRNAGLISKLERTV